jgi:hypothetical protein
MLASPLLVGVLAAGPRGVHLPLAAFWFVGYFAFFATGLWLKSRRRSRYLPPVRAYLAAAAALGVSVVVLQPGLLRWAPLFIVPLGVGLWSSAHRTDRSLLSGLATSLGSALMTLVAYDAGDGGDWARAWWLTAVQAAYFAGTVFYVKSLIRERGNQAFRRLSVGYHAVVAAVGLLALAVGWRTPGVDGDGLAWPVVVVLAVLAVRAAVVPRFGLRPAQIGIGELAATVAVALTSLVA